MAYTSADMFRLLLLASHECPEGEPSGSEHRQERHSEPKEKIHRIKVRRCDGNRQASGLPKRGAPPVTIHNRALSAFPIESGSNGYVLAPPTHDIVY